jgi:UDP-N-acetylmuramoylalanine--D-glutamate ligase
MNTYEVVVLGGGESGIGAALLAKHKNFKVFLSEAGKLADKYRQILLKEGISFEEEKHSEEIIFSAKTIVKSPGIPEKAPVIKTAREKGIEIISEIEFGARFTQKKIVAITGTNGKTTTTLLTHHLLNGGKIRATLAGNVGKSFAAAVIDDEKTDVYVLEVSSFQLDDIQTFRPYVALLLNITPDHLDRYEYSLEKYARAKYRITENQTNSDFFIFNEADPLCNQVETEAQKRGVRADRSFGNVRLENDALSVGKFSPIPVEKLPLRGRHNMLNMIFAIQVADIFDLEQSYLEEKLQTFVNAPHRLQFIAEINGVKYINDSKATNVDAVSYALDAFKEKLVWIAGGVDKGNDYSLIEDLAIKNVRVLICLGKDNKKLAEHFSGKISRIIDTNSMQAAIEAANREAKPGEIVLLSPACASFDLFNNYEHRGAVFAETVENLREKMTF